MLVEDGATATEGVTADCVIVSVRLALLLAANVLPPP
jgi:hypothetical protein